MIRHFEISERSSKETPDVTGRIQIPGPLLFDGNRLSGIVAAAAILVVMLLIAAAAYLMYSRQEGLQWQEAAHQLSIGQELLRADRDDLLQKMRDRETELANLEQLAAQDKVRIAVLEEQRRDLQTEVVRLRHDLEDAKGRSRTDGGTGNQRDQNASPTRAQDAVSRRIAEQEDIIARLRVTLKDKERALNDSQASDRGTSLEKTVGRLEAALSALRQKNRFRQAIRNHRASFGEVKPYLADVDASYWEAIETWLDQQLGRPMEIPDLSSYGWSYEGARIVLALEGPAMAMLLYVDQEGQPLSFTIARDADGEQGLRTHREAGLTLLEWHDDKHAFVLAGEADMVTLQVMASVLMDPSNERTAGTEVPSSRYFRPEFRPEAP